MIGRDYRLRFVAELDPSPAEASLLAPEAEVSFVPMEAVGEFGGLDLSQTKPRSAVQNGHTFFRDGDVVIAKITPCFENGKGALAAGLAHGIGFGTTELHVLRPGPLVDARFLFYLVMSDWFRQPGAAAMYGAGGQKRVPDDFVQDFRFQLFPLPRQRAIAAFLDRKTAEIDTLIAKKERLLELLEEKRTALITQAVTKGITPGVEMRATEVAGLGEIPSHWRVWPLKRVGDVRSGVAKGRDLGGEGVSVPYLRVANVQGGYLNLEDVAEIEVTRTEVSRFALRRGDVLMNEGGDYDKLGRGFVWEGQIDPCVHQNHVFAIRLGHRATPYWVSLATQASYLRFYFMQKSKQSTNLASISATNLGLAPIACPPLEEQEAILEWFGLMSSQLGLMRGKVEGAIALLREYRTALITAAVTGQIEVPVS